MAKVPYLKEMQDLQEAIDSALEKLHEMDCDTDAEEEITKAAIANRLVQVQACKILIKSGAFPWA